MYAIVWRYLPKGSWRLSERVFDDKEKAEAEAASTNDEHVRSKAIYIGDSEDWK